MSGNNKPTIPVYWIDVNGSAESCEKTMEAVFDVVHTELEDHWLSRNEKIITIRADEMLESEYKRGHGNGD